jgi:hypothetical protein
VRVVSVVDSRGAVDNDHTKNRQALHRVVLVLALASVVRPVPQPVPATSSLPQPIDNDTNAAIIYCMAFHHNTETATIQWKCGCFLFTRSFVRSHFGAVVVVHDKPETVVACCDSELQKNRARGARTRRIAFGVGCEGEDVRTPGDSTTSTMNTSTYPKLFSRGDTTWCRVACRRKMTLELEP